MTTKEYIVKYKLSASNKFDHTEFVEDLLMDFMTLLEVGKSPSKGLNIKGFENSVNALRQKWNAIHNKTVDGGLPEKLWGFFYATKIVKMRDELFPKEMERRNQEREDNKRRYEQRKRFNAEQDSMFDNFFFNAMFASLFSKRARPVESFTILGLDSSAGEDEVKTAYRKLALEAHPDKGGSQDKFIAITEAKNKCLVYLSKLQPNT
jgi:hypothetical protein